jgi:hypothetical protein
MPLTKLAGGILTKQKRISQVGESDDMFASVAGTTMNQPYRYVLPRTG